MRIISLFLVLLSTCFVTMGQQQQTADQARDAICQRVPCRPVTTVRLKLNNKEYSEMEFPRGPYVAEGFINVLAGEEVLVEFDDTDGMLSNPHYVKTGAKSERTISFRLEQTDEGTVLRVRIRLPKALRTTVHSALQRTAPPKNEYYSGASRPCEFRNVALSGCSGCYLKYSLCSKMNGVEPLDA